MRHLSVAILLTLACSAHARGADHKRAAPKPLVHAHAHNDYLHARPLLDALDHGFGSVEADIHLIGGQLLVAHDQKEAEARAGSTAHTLQALYLDPLRARAEANGGRIYPGLPSLRLLIDLKEKPPGPEYAALLDVLKRYRSILTTWDAAGEHVRAVTVIITGNHTHAMISRDPVRYCASDGILPDLDRPNLPPDVCPLISSDWKKTFHWDGTGLMPEAERALLRRLVEKAHQQHRQIRFWDAPDNAAAWAELRAAGVDWINTDDLAGLQAFLLKEKGEDRNTNRHE
jgi:hypothetical protein